jgi:hypothetical protein
MKWIRYSAAVLCLAASACVQMPTEKSGVVDMRPQLNFQITGSADGAVVLIDGLDMGPVSAYLDGGGKQADSNLRVLPGTHQVQVVRGGAILADERVYLADGVTKTILVH